MTEPATAYTCTGYVISGGALYHAGPCPMHPQAPIPAAEVSSETLEAVDSGPMSMDMRADADVRYSNLDQPTRDQVIRIHALGIANNRNPLTSDATSVIIEADMFAKWISDGTLDTA